MMDNDLISIVFLFEGKIHRPKHPSIQSVNQTFIDNFRSFFDSLQYTQ